MVCLPTNVPLVGETWWKGLLGPISGLDGMIGRSLQAFSASMMRSMGLGTKSQIAGKPQPAIMSRQSFAGMARPM